jgi:hypothetical protein
MAKGPHVAATEARNGKDGHGSFSRARIGPEQPCDGPRGATSIVFAL